MRRSRYIAGILLVALLAAILLPDLWQSNQVIQPGKVPGSAQLASPPIRNLGPASEQVTAEQTASTLSRVDAPGRDLIAITRRLKLRNPSASIPLVVNATPPNYTLGTRQKFYVADIVNKNYYTINATIKEVTPHAYWYVKDGYAIDLAALKASARVFEERIYVNDRRVFGPEPSPGIDNDPHITVLITPMQAVSGYFSSADAYSKIINPYSNERKMIYISTRPAAPAGASGNPFEGTLAHEFQHMIHWNVHRDRDVWLDEGCSEIAMYMSGYSPGSFDYLFASRPDIQLNAWGAEPATSTAHYGASYLFLRYLMSRYGGEAFLKKVIQSSGLGTDAIDTAVKSSGNSTGFDGVFKDWVVANRLNDPTIANGRYSYPEGGRAADTRVISSYPATRSETVHQYAADYIKLTGDLPHATVNFKGDATARVIAAGPHGDQAFWYSNRRDSGDATLTHEFDLTRTRTATLQFWAWYDIESTFDYAYAEASTDGGRTWTTLKGRYTTTSNPNGASFGNAWTGRSGLPQSSSASARWVQESMSLNAYAGTRVLVRFEYITDEGYNAPGLAIDDLSIRDIGYSDGAESDNGWTAQGFVRIGNTLPEHWYVAVIANGTNARVLEVPVAPDGSGSVNLDGLGDTVRDATLVIAPMAPKTTETANYTVTIRQR